MKTPIWTGEYMGAQLDVWLDSEKEGIVCFSLDMIDEIVTCEAFIENLRPGTPLDISSVLKVVDGAVLQLVRAQQQEYIADGNRFH